jgi:hypothetical protein
MWNIFEILGIEFCKGNWAIQWKESFVEPYKKCMGILEYLKRWHSYTNLRGFEDAFR